MVEEDTSQVVFPSEDSSGVLRSCTALMEALVGTLNTKPLDVKAKACHGTPSVESQNKRGGGRGRERKEEGKGVPAPKIHTVGYSQL